MFNNPNDEVTTIASGDRCHLILNRSLSPRGWGDNTSNQLGIGCTPMRLIATSTELGIKTSPYYISAGAAHVFTGGLDSKLVGWGWNYDWHVGTNDGTCNGNLNQMDNLLPEKYGYYDNSSLVPYGDFRAVCGALRNTFTIGLNGQVYSWGSNKASELCINGATCSGTSTNWDRNRRQWVPDATVITTESTGNGSSSSDNVMAVVVTSNKGCEGNPEGNGEGYKYISAPVFAVTATGRVVGWGKNFGLYKDLTAENTCIDCSTAVYIYKNSANPVPLDNIVSIAGGPHFGIALDATGHLWKWGHQIVNAETPVPVPNPYAYATQIEGIENVKAIAVGGYLYDGNFIMALNASGTIYVMGDNRSGQCGISNPTTVPYQSSFALMYDSNPVPQSSPPYVSQLSNSVKAIDASQKNGMALRADGTLWTWGANIDGQYGNCNHLLGVPLNLPYIPHQARKSPCTVTQNVQYLNNVTAITNSCNCSFGMDITGTIYSSGSNNKLVRGILNQTTPPDERVFTSAPDIHFLYNQIFKDDRDPKGIINTVDEFESYQESLKIFPNPVLENAILNIESKSSSIPVRISLYSSVGSEIFTSDINSIPIRVSLYNLMKAGNGLSCGVYVVVVTFKDGTMERKQFVIE